MSGLRENAWLGGVLGYPVYAIDPHAPGVAAEVHAQATAAGRALYFAKVPVERVDLVGALSRAGLTVVDVNVTLARGGEPPAGGPVAGVAVAPLRQEDAEQVLAIAGSCFRFSRFHLDPAIPDELAHRVKREWIGSYARGARGVELLVASVEGRPAGFLAVLEAPEDGCRVRVIDLIGVAEASQRRGVGSALVRAFVERHGPAGAGLRVGTQIANVPSLALYYRHGFEIARSSYVMHMHAGG